MKKTKLKFNELFFEQYKKLQEKKIKTEFKEEALKAAFPEINEKRAFNRFSNYQNNKAPMPFLVYEKFCQILQKYTNEEQNSEKNERAESFAGGTSQINKCICYDNLEDIQ